MASTQAVVTPSRRAEPEKIVDFSPELLKAPFLLRCAALCIDYIIVIALPVGWLVATRLFGDRNSSGLGGFIWFIGAVMLVVNVVLFPLLRGQTIGKMLAGITIVNIDGTYLRLGGIVRRNIIGYFVTAITLGIGFLLSGINPSGRALHDLIGGTTVVRARRTQI